MEIDKRVIETYTLFKRHVFLLENHYKNQDSVISNIEQAIVERKEDKLREILDLFNYVFLFVDLAVRIQKIAHSVPRINYKTKEYRAFDSSLKNLKKLRNRFQHINNEVSSDGTDHLLGTISWHSRSKIFSVSFQDISRSRSGHSIPFEVTEEQKLKVRYYLCYVLEDQTYDIDTISSACIKLCEYIDSKIKLRDKNGKVDLRKKYDAWAIKLKEVDGGVTVEWA